MVVEQRRGVVRAPCEHPGRLSERAVGEAASDERRVVGLGQPVLLVLAGDGEAGRA